MIDDFDEFNDAQRGAPSPTGEIRHGVRHLARDIVTLAELQANLLQVETRNWLKKVAIPALALAIAAAIAALASLPILLLSLAYWLVDAWAWPLPLALLAAGGVGLLGAVLCGVVAAQRLRRGNDAFARFRLELARNVRWLKQILGRPTAVADPYASDPFASDAATLRPR
jgi:hypothetical protein